MVKPDRLSELGLQLGGSMSDRSELSEASAGSRALAVALEQAVGSVYSAPEARPALVPLAGAPW